KLPVGLSPPPIPPTLSLGHRHPPTHTHTPAISLCLCGPCPSRLFILPPRPQGDYEIGGGMQEAWAGQHSVGGGLSRIELGSGSLPCFHP
uniref:Uncharacterized protein n=1 Tax=Chrysemys picta bellii TaxID=8478 RepID=A0A8C3IH44_CHRPI